jgi:D-arabinono-1,4-lactone oxidase
MDWAAPNLPNPEPNQGGNSCPSLSSLDPQLQQELSRLDSAIPFNPQTRYLHHTWAQTFFSRPELYFQPSTVPELQKIVTLARRLRKRICVTGYGHSPSDLTCTSSWLINLDNLSRIESLSKDGLITFEAGLSLHDLNTHLNANGFTLPNLGSIDVQSVAGSISTGTHGSSLSHGLLSANVTSLIVLLANSQLVTCSATKNPELFRAALLSLGSLGIIVSLTFQAVPSFSLSWTQTLHPLSSILSKWDSTLWTDKEYTRVWWMPYSHRAVIWSAARTEEPLRPPNTTFYGGKLGYYLYHNLLYISHYIPRILPWVEWFIFGMQYGFHPGNFTMSAVEPAKDALLMNCLYSQFVNEWALPLSKGPEAIVRLGAWIDGDVETARIPFSSKNLWVHCPIEVRVSNTNLESPLAKSACGVRPYLDPTCADGPTLYLNATLYRPYGKDPPCWQRYYKAFEWLMRDLGGRPHWAKNFSYTNQKQIDEMYGADMRDFMKIRNDVDPEGMFVGEWHRRYLPIDEGKGEKVIHTRRMGTGYGDGVLWTGMVDVGADGQVDADIREVISMNEKDVGDGNGETTPSPPMTSTSDESFDYMARGEASVYQGQTAGGREKKE